MSDMVMFVDGKRLYGEAIPRILASQQDLREKFDTAFNDARALTGLDPRDMNRIATGVRFHPPAGATNQSGDSWVSITQGFDYGNWLAFMRQQRPGVLRESQHGGKTLHVMKLNESEKEKFELIAMRALDGNELAVAALNADTLAFGAPADVRLAIDAGAEGGARVSADLVAAVTRNPNALISMAGLQPPRLMSDILSGSKLEGSELSKALSSLKQFSAAVEFAPEGLAVTMSSSIGSAEQAKTLGDVLTAFKTLAAITPGKNTRDKMGLEILKGSAISTTGAEVQVRIELKQEMVIALVKRIAADDYNASGVAHKNKGELDAAIADYDRAIALAPDSAAAYINRGRAKSNKGDFDAALADYDNAIALDPDNATAYNNRGLTRLDKGDLDGAIVDLNKSIALDPGHAYAYNNRGLALFKKGKLAEALDDYDKSIALDSKNALAYTNRGFARHQQRDLDRAIADFNKTIALDPGSADAYSGRGYARTDQGDYDGAIDDFGKAVAINPKSADAYNGRGLARYYKEDLDGALADYDKAITLSPDDAVVYANRGVARIDKGSLSEAVADFNRAIAINPDLAEAYNGRGVAQYQQGNFTQAIVDLGKAIAIRPDYAEAYGYRALSRLALGRDAEASRDLKKCFELDAALQPVFEALAEEVMETRRAKPRRPH